MKRLCLALQPESKKSKPCLRLQKEVQKQKPLEQKTLKQRLREKEPLKEAKEGNRHQKKLGNNLLKAVIYMKG